MTARQHASKKNRIIIIGGSGMIGGALVHYFNKCHARGIEVLSPNSKMLNLKNVADLERYFRHWRPDFIVNCAIASINADPQLTYAVNYVAAINLARVALALKIPYIHISSAAVLPAGRNLDENSRLKLTAKMSSYAKSKVMCELTLEQLHQEEGLDYTIVRLAIVYGKHDYKIQGFHRLLFSVADQAMGFLFTGKGVQHSYTNAKKLPGFIHHILQNRQEFNGRTYHFVDPEPVKMAELILTIRDHLQAAKPKKIFVPLPVARTGLGMLNILLKFLVRLGIEARMPAELLFLDQFYQTQTLSNEKLLASSYTDPAPNDTILSKLPEIIEYYISRWEQLNLLSQGENENLDTNGEAQDFHNSPEKLLDAIHSKQVNPFGDFKNL